MTVLEPFESEKRRSAFQADQLVAANNRQAESLTYVVNVAEASCFGKRYTDDYLSTQRVLVASQDNDQAGHNFGDRLFVLRGVGNSL